MQFRPPPQTMQAFSGPPFVTPGLGIPPGMPPPHLLRPPMMMQPPPVNPLVLTPPGSTLSPAPATKSTTLYVGKIAATISDDEIQTLLEACGPVKSWKPMQDPETNKSKGFGFCEYETAEGVLRALRLLHNLSVDGQELLLKCNTATQRYIDDYQAVKAREAASKAAKQKQSADKSADKDANAGSAGEATDDKEDDAVLAKIMGLVSDRAAQQSGATATDQANKFLNEVLPPPPRRDRQSSAKEPFSSGKDRDRDHTSKERERGISADRAAERQIEKERAREKREAELRKADQDRAMERVYEKKLREWEHTERLREKAADKERADRKATEKDRAKLIRNDNDMEDEDEDEEPWQRRLLHTSRHTESRRRKRKEERKLDAADAAAEEEERAAARQKHEEDAQLRAEEEAAQSSHESDADQANGDIDMADAKEEDIDPDDPIYQAMIAAAQAPPRATSPQQAQHDAHDPAARPQAPHLKPAAASKAGWHSVFGDAEQEAPTRQLIPLKYSAEEQQAAQAAASAAAAANANAANGASPGPAPVANKEEEIDKLKKQIPRSMQALTSSSINWEAYDDAQPKIGAKVGKWVSGQIEKLLGQQEDTLLNFVQGELNKHSTPAALLNELSPILDLEGEEFVLKLYQIVIFESSKFALLGQM